MNNEMSLGNDLAEIRKLKHEVMIPGVHYGSPFPGSDKPVLLKAGAELIAKMFGLRPTYNIDHAIRDFGTAKTEPLFYFELTCRLMEGENIVGEGGGICSSWEDRYRWRKGERLCPACGNASLIHSKPEYGGGWYCFPKRGGCGTKFDENDPRVVNQPTGKVLNDSPFDLINTIRKIAEKRAFVGAVLVATGASYLFTQDEELLETIEEQQAQQISAAIPANEPTVIQTYEQEKDRNAEPWQQVISGWSQSEWGAYWQEMSNRGLSADDVHWALGGSAKDFNGTRGEHHAAIYSIEEAKKQPVQPGSYIVARIHARRTGLDLPEVTIYTDSGNALYTQVSSIDLLEMFPDSKAPNNAGIDIYDAALDDGVTVVTVDFAADGSATFAKS